VDLARFAIQRHAPIVIGYGTQGSNTRNGIVSFQP
jgi:hypothetical protein